MNAFGVRKLNIKSILFIAIMAVLSAAVCVLLFCLNITPAVALEQEIRCGIEEHTHTDNCYNGDFLVCEKPAHTHDGNCYIVLLKDNNINGILTLLGNSETRSLEYVITDTMSSALTFNTNLNTSQATDADTLTLSQDTVVALNTTISDDETLPDIVLNEKINTVSTLALDNPANNDTNSTLNSASTYSVGDSPVTANYNANFYVYLDGKWTCIGTLPFTTTSNGGNRYNGTIQTSEILKLVNGALGTDYNYNSFDIAVSTSQNSGYSTSNIGMNSVTTTVAYNQSNSNVRKVRYVRLIPNNGSANSTTFNFFTVKFEYPDGSAITKYVRSGTTVTLPEGNYEWKVGNTNYTAGQAVTIRSATTFVGTLIGPPTFVNINYNVNFPTVSGVTVSTKPTLAGLTVTTIRDEYTEGSSVTVRNVSQQSVEGKVNGNTTGLSRVIQFKGWRVGNSDIIIRPNTNLIWEELLQYSSNSTTLNLNAVWESEAVRTASFFIRFDSVAVDTDGNVTGQDSNKYTSELFSAYVGGIDTSKSVTQLQNLYGIADTTSDNSFGADGEIRALYGERTDGVWMSALPTDDYIFQSLVQYANTGYYPSKNFENTGISISGIINSPTESTAKDIVNHIKDNNIESASAVTKNGKASFSDLSLGIWLVFCEAGGKYTFNPYFVFLPYESGGKLYYEITSSPKAEDSNPNLINIYVVKKWDDKNNTAKKRPESVTVELLDGEKVISSVVLNEQNGWAHTFTNVSKNGNYSVKEKKVENYTAGYSGDVLGGFIVTNSYNGEKLPQTGQLWWPIIIISVAGIAFVLLGIIELGARKNGKKK